MEPNTEEMNKLQAQLAIKQLQERERLIREARKSWHPTEYFSLLFLLVIVGVMYWATRREWTSADTTLLIFISGTMGYGTIGIHKRIDAVLKLLELDGFLKLTGKNIKSVP